MNTSNTYTQCGEEMQRQRQSVPKSRRNQVVNISVTAGENYNNAGLNRNMFVYV